MSKHYTQNKKMEMEMVQARVRMHVTHNSKQPCVGEQMVEILEKNRDKRDESKLADMGRHHRAG